MEGTSGTHRTRRLDVLFEGGWIADCFSISCMRVEMFLSILLHNHYCFVSAVGLLLYCHYNQGCWKRDRYMGFATEAFLSRYLRYTNSMLKESCHPLASKTFTRRISYSTDNYPQQSAAPLLLMAFTAKSTQVSKHIDSINSILSHGSNQSHYNLRFLPPSNFPKTRKHRTVPPKPSICQT